MIVLYDCHKQVLYSPADNKHSLLEMSVQEVTEPVTLGEGPHWDAENQCLYFVSIFDNTIHKYIPSNNVHTRTKVDGKPTFIIPLEGKKDEFVVGLNRKLVSIKWNGEDNAAVDVKEIAEVDQNYSNNRFNDAKADPKGRLFAGTMGFEYEPGKFETDKGSFYRFNKHGICEKLFGDVGISNGLCWDEIDKAFYYIDSLAYSVKRYDYDVDSGYISNPKVIFDFKHHNIPGIPDGMTIDTEGSLWIANFGGSQVLQINPEYGKLLRKIPIPALQVTSVTFGGPNLDDLYLTSAIMDHGQKQFSPNGSTFKITGLGVKGYAGVPVTFE